MRWIWKWLRRLFLLCVAAALAAGLYVGNTVYEDLIGSPWDRILGIRNQTGDLVRVHEREQEWGWEPDVLSCCCGFSVLLRKKTFGWKIPVCLPNTIYCLPGWMRP